MATGVKELEVFVSDALKAGASAPAIEEAMVQAGWSAGQAKAALQAYAPTSFGVPVPRPSPSLSAREVFFYLVMFTALYISTFALGSLLFDFIEMAFPDSVDPYYHLEFWDSSRGSVSSLIIAFPLFLFMADRIGKELVANPAKRLSGVRYWLTYMTMFLATCFLIGDATVLVYNALGGELTTRFVLKVLVVAMIAGTVFGYYLSNLKTKGDKA